MSAEPVLHQPFTNLQLELLRLFANEVNEEDLLKIKAMLAHFFFEKAKDAADQAWLEKDLNELGLLQQHQRTTYHVPKQ